MLYRNIQGPAMLSVFEIAFAFIIQLLLALSPETSIKFAFFLLPSQLEHHVRGVSALPSRLPALEFDIMAC